MANKRITSPSAPAAAQKATKPVSTTVKAAPNGNWQSDQQGLLSFAQTLPSGPIASPSPIPNQSQGGVGGSTSGRSGGGGYSSVSPTATGVMAAEPMPSPQPQSYDAWKQGGGHVGDSTWAAENASAEAEYQSLLASLAQQNTGFQNDWRSGLKSMGWQFGAEGDRSGQWNPDDLVGAYGQTRNNMVNDFSGRGMMDSTFYQDALQNTDRRFNQQRDDMLRSYDETQGRFETDRANAGKSRESAQQRALAEAYSRYASGYGI